MVCADVVIEEDMLAMIDGLNGQLVGLVCADVVMEEDMLAMFDSLNGQLVGHDSWPQSACSSKVQ